MFESVGCDDLLPRAAPKPTDMNEAVVTPTVPEVSLLQDAVKPTQTTTMPGKPAMKTYSEFKKSMLPKVTFSSAGLETPQCMAICSTIANSNKEVVHESRSNLYPLRAPITTTTLPSTVPMFNYNKDNIETVTTTAEPKLTHCASAAHYRRSLESALLYPTEHELKVLSNTLAMKQLQEQHQRSIDAIMQNSNTPIRTNNEVLTICAGTQTDTTKSTGIANETLTQLLQNVASKDTVAELMLKVDTMQKEQQRLIHICEILLLSNQLKLPNIAIPNDACIDVEYQKENEQCTTNNNRAMQQQLRDALQVQTPMIKPAAQSTAYHGNSPMQKRMDAVYTPQQIHNHVNTIEKPSTERSLVMNELAIKYLTNEKLTEFMQEMNLGATTAELPQTPLRNIDNVDKGVCDLSNASYKYLKKYRLLPEENGYGSTPQFMPQQTDYAKSPGILKQKQVNSPLCQQRQQQYSPFQRPNSPLYAGKNVEQIDLENIRRQPKFL